MKDVRSLWAAKYNENKSERLHSQIKALLELSYRSHPLSYERQATICDSTWTTFLEAHKTIIKQISQFIETATFLTPIADDEKLKNLLAELANHKDQLNDNYAKMVGNEGYDLPNDFQQTTINNHAYQLIIKVIETQDTLISICLSSLFDKLQKTAIQAILYDYQERYVQLLENHNALFRPSNAAPQAQKKQYTEPNLTENTTTDAAMFDVPDEEVMDGYDDAMNWAITQSLETSPRSSPGTQSHSDEEDEEFKIAIEMSLREVKKDVQPLRYEQPDLRDEEEEALALAISLSLYEQEIEQQRFGL